jgi:hypothetical protein
MGNSNKMESERKYLVDFVNSLAKKYGIGVIENLNYAEKFLHEDESLPPEKTLCGKLLRHAKGLRHPASADVDYNPNTIIARLEEKELPVVKNYLQALEAYILGKSYLQTIFPAAAKLLKPIPVTGFAKIPDTEYYRNLQFVRQLV